MSEEQENIRTYHWSKWLATQKESRRTTTPIEDRVFIRMPKEALGIAKEWKARWCNKSQAWYYDRRIERASEAFTGLRRKNQGELRAKFRQAVAAAKAAAQARAAERKLEKTVKESKLARLPSVPVSIPLTDYKPS